MNTNRNNPFFSKIKERYLLTKEGSSKKTYHVVLDIKGSGLDFKVGDSLGIYPQNDPIHVEKLLNTCGGDKEILEPRTGNPSTLKDLLTFKSNLTRITNDPISEFAPLLPRFYSVASSLKENADEVHLTVALTEFIVDGEKKYGVASHFLCHLAEIDKTLIPIYVQPSAHFTLPQDHSIPIIMIGPGTGIAPFRAFMQERAKANAQGDHWLFFGERNRKTDFFYEEFWLSHVNSGKLRLDLAFSRDQEHKEYVQHKMLHNAPDVWKWIEQGAITYVCGDADPMGKDVEATLLHIIKEHGSMPEEDAKAFLKNLRKQKRLLFDTY